MTKGKTMTFGTMLSDQGFLTLVKTEVRQARDAGKPTESHLATLITRMGDLANALSSGDREKVLDVRVRVAAMAFRVATEEDPYVEYPTPQERGARP